MMGNVKTRIRLGELRPGMILAEGIRNQNKILVASGVIVTDNIIKKLKEKVLVGDIVIYTMEEEDTNKAEEDKRFDNTGETKRKTAEDINKEFNEFTFDAESIFDNMYSASTYGLNEVRNFAQRIQSELEAASAIIKNIVLYGSGTDSVYRHSVNVAALSSLLAGWIGLNEKDIKLLTYSAILHDIGKMKINPDLLNKPRSLTREEFEKIKKHPVIGYDLVKEIAYLGKAVSYGILMHHERIDGSGYPLGITGEKIHEFAKIIAIADVFDAINSNRAYKKKKSPFEALELIQKESLGKLDYEFSKIFLEHVVNYYMGEEVVLNTNKVCKIVQININDLSRPLLFDGSGFVDLNHEKDLFVVSLV